MRYCQVPSKNVILIAFPLKIYRSVVFHSLAKRMHSQCILIVGNLTAKKEGHSVALICTYPVIWIPHIFCMCLPHVSVHFYMELVLFLLKNWEYFTCLQHSHVTNIYVGCVSSLYGNFCHRSYLFNYYY